MESTRGSCRQIGSVGEWVDTQLAVVSATKIVTVDQLGDMYATDPATGASKKVNEEKYTASQFLFGTQALVFNIDRNGTLYATCIEDGTCKQLSDYANYSSAMGANCKDGFVTVGAKSGKPFFTNSQGEVSKINDDNFLQCQFIFGGAEFFFIIENNNLFSVNPADGAYKKLGDTGAFANTKLGAGANDKVYTLETTGVIWETDGVSGVYSKLVEDGFLDTRIMFAGNDALYAILPTGNLYEISL